MKIYLNELLEKFRSHGNLCVAHGDEKKADGRIRRYFPLYDLDAFDWRKKNAEYVAREMFLLAATDPAECATARDRDAVYLCRGALKTIVELSILETNDLDEAVTDLAREGFINEPPIDWEKTHEAQKSDRDDLDYESLRDREYREASRLMLANLGGTTPQAKGE